MLRLRNDFPRAVLLVVSSVVAVIVPACEQSSQHEPVASSRGVAVTFARDVAPIVSRNAQRAIIQARRPRSAC